MFKENTELGFQVIGKIFISNNISQNVFAFTVGGNVCGRTFETRTCIQAIYIEHFQLKEKNSYKSGRIFTVIMSLESNFSEVIPVAAVQNFS